MISAAGVGIKVGVVSGDVDVDHVAAGEPGPHVLGCEWTRDVDHVHAAGAARDEGIAARHGDAGRLAAERNLGDLTGRGRIAEVDDHQALGSARHVGEEATDDHVLGRAPGIDVPHQMRRPRIGQLE